MAENSQTSPDRGLVAGHVIGLSASSESALADLQSALGGYQAPRAATEFVLHAAPGSLSRPRRPADRTVQDMEFWVDAGAVTVCLQAGPIARVDHDRAVLDPGVASQRGCHALLLPVLSLLLSQRGQCVMHAAAYLDTRAGGAVLGLGASGRGKSTLIVAALAAGVPVLGDDLVALRLDLAGQVEVAGVPQPLTLPGDLAADPVLGRPIDGDPRGRHRPAVSPQLVKGWHPVAAVVLLSHSADRDGRLETATSAEVFHEALLSTVAGLSPVTVQDAFPFAAAVGRVPARRLAHAQDPGRRVGAAQRLLAMPCAATD